MSLSPELRAHALAAKGFMPPDEGDALYDAAGAAGAALPGLPFLEVGSYCGRSTVWLGGAARKCGTVVFAVDHHRGSEENQAGWEHHDPTLGDPRIGKMDTLPFFRRTMHRAGLEDVVVAIVGYSMPVARVWRTPLGFLFIDGGHAEDVAMADYIGWTPHLAPAGVLAIHDVFEDPAEGGQAPFRVWQRAVEDGLAPIATTGSLRVLRKR